jgi:hypothetical protein
VGRWSHNDSSSLDWRSAPARSSDQGRSHGAVVGDSCLWAMRPRQAFRAVRCVNHDGRRSLSVEHCVERRGETLTTAREAGTPTRLVRSNALFCGTPIGPKVAFIVGLPIDPIPLWTARHWPGHIPNHRLETRWIPAPDPSAHTTIAPTRYVFSEAHRQPAAWATRPLACPAEIHLG